MFNPKYKFTYDEVRIIVFALIELHTISNSFENQKIIRQLLTSFELVSESWNYEQDFEKTVIDRNMKDYDLIMRWSKVFLLNKSFTTFSGTTKARALLFPMETIFESYVAQELRKAVRDYNWEVTTKDKGHYLFDSPKRFALIPDIVLTRDDGSTVIMDTKWKRLFDNPNKNYGISQADMYQMYAYSKKYNTPEIWLLYPVNEDMRDYEEISYNSDDNVNVKIFFVDVANITESMEQLRSLVS